MLLILSMLYSLEITGTKTPVLRFLALAAH